MTDPAAAAAMVSRLEHDQGVALLGFARRLGIDDAAAADVVQEGLLRLYDSIVGGARLDDPRAWVYRVVYRLAMDEHRRRRHWASALAIDASAPAPPSDDPVSVAERRLVWTEVDQLPDRQRAVLYLRYRADLPFDAVGRVLGITSSAARSHATQAIATLRSRLAHEVMD